MAPQTFLNRRSLFLYRIIVLSSLSRVSVNRLLEPSWTRSNHFKVGLLRSSIPSNNFVLYQEATGYWIKALHGLPLYKKNQILKVIPVSDILK